MKKARECIEQAHFLDKLRPTSFLVEMLVTVKQNPENIEKSVRRFLRRFKSMTKLLRYLATVIITTDSFLAEHWKDILFMILHTLKKMQMKKSMEYFENVPRRKLSGLLVRKMATISFKSAFLQI